MIARTSASRSRMHRALPFLPLALLVAAALLTNVGGGIASSARAANTITATATILSDRHITSTCGTGGTVGTLAFGSINAGTGYENDGSPCLIAFGSTQATTNLQVQASATNLGWAGFSAIGTTCATPTAGQIGIRADSTSTATPTAPFNCSDGQVRRANTTASTLCSSTAGADKNCALVVGFHTGAVASGAKSGVLTTSLT